MGQQTTNVAVVGAGVVGGGVAKILQERQAHFEKDRNLSIRLKAVCDVDSDRIDALELENVQKLSDYRPALDDPKIDIIVETIGGCGVAKELTLAALEKGKSVVTANKALLAMHGPEIFPKAAEKGLFVGFEASVGGGIPVIRTVLNSFAPETVQEVRGIINGTCNYILTEMTQRGSDYEEVLKEAQAKGYAEADPTFDVQGQDSLHKLTLLSWLAFGRWIPYESLYHSGIENVNAIDIQLAEESGYCFKLLAVARRTLQDRLIVYVAPHLVRLDDELASVHGVLNAIQLHSNYLGPTLLSGQGAGRWPTASAVVSDIVNIARKTVQGASPHYPECVPVAQDSPTGLLAMEETVHRYFLRFTVEDTPGVMANLAKALGDQSISISTVIQHSERTREAWANIVVMTHSASEAALGAALQTVEGMKECKAAPVFFRILDPLT